ncbi:MAG: DinB family protein [Chloroflexi bacterium]|nr:DinB family protein [Chloroflexota bacterium]
MSEPKASSEQLADYHRQFEAIKRDADELLAGLDDARFNWRSAPGRWSIAQCFNHLNVFGNKLLPLMDKAIERSRTNNLTSQRRARYGLFGGFFLRMTEPPARVKVKAPKIYLPSPERPLVEEASQFAQLQEDMIKRTELANGVDLSRTKISSPFSSLLTFNLATWFAVTAAHERRHLWQAREIISHKDFPR